MSINRLSHFLNLEELNPNNVEKTMPEHSKLLTDCSCLVSITGQQGSMMRSMGDLCSLPIICVCFKRGGPFLKAPETLLVHKAIFQLVCKSKISKVYTHVCLKLLVKREHLFILRIIFCE